MIFIHIFNYICNMYVPVEYFFKVDLNKLLKCVCVCVCVYACACGTKNPCICGDLFFFVSSGIFFIFSFTTFGAT